MLRSGMVHILPNPTNNWNSADPLQLGDEGHKEHDNSAQLAMQSFVNSKLPMNAS